MLQREYGLLVLKHVSPISHAENSDLLFLVVALLLCHISTRNIESLHKRNKVKTMRKCVQCTVFRFRIPK